MTYTQDTPSRLDRIEALMLEIATASVRHDNEFSRINATLQTMGTRLDQVTERIDQVTERIDQVTERIDRVTERIDQVTERIDQVTIQQAANQEAIAHLTASILDLRNVVSDYIQRRSDVDPH
ncbi:MAG TPA: hypothetical protein V6C88_18675 [Chroococcidiopsis sp.]